MPDTKDSPPRNQVVRIKDVASAAGVSPATVSLVYNNKGEVAQETRKKVLETGRNLGYRANPLGRALRTGQSRILGVLVSYRDSPVWQETYLPYYREIIADAAIEAMEHGYSVAAAAPGKRDLEGAFANLDGAIVVDPVQDDAIVEYCAARGVPLVADGGFVGEKRGEKQISIRGNVEVYLREILDETARQFQARTGRNLSDIRLFTGSVIDRYTADTGRVFTEWCGENRVIPRSTAVTPGDDVNDIARRILAEDRPEALYCLNESYSTAVIDAAAALGLRIPEDVVLSSAATSTQAKQDPRVNYVESTDEASPGKLAVRTLVNFLETGSAEDSTTEYRLRPARLGAAGREM
ncbi:LacI family DNA-binding transcriptional regulator [Paeniglutamicibacter sp. R2-26]|uniref:LacI family DNA-binding transcriptional regulator n=1 Tax=Paeniglutamicibacter sp. R2-26 TaxID=3144417 RepID=UPI003EE5B63F